ncbi:MAG TPA: hypothetical protein DHU56_13360 [Marinobacter sp.]|nr:hypothetical protein [Marinobacter sp.]
MTDHNPQSFIPGAMPDEKKGKILYIETGMGFGGSAISLKQIVKNLRNYQPVVVFYAASGQYFSDHFQGIDTRFFDLRFTYKQKDTLRDFIQKYTKSTLITKLSLKFFSYFSYFYDKVTVYKLCQIIKDENIALMHINNGIDPIAVNAARRCGIPCIAHSRGHEQVPPKTKNINYIVKLIAPTQKIAHHDHNHIGVPSGKITVIHNSIDLNSYSNKNCRSGLRDNYGIEQKDVVIGMFARIIPMKGQLVLVKAVCQLRNMGYPIKCIFVGDASDYGESYLKEIRSYINEKGQGDAFCFAGYQSDTAKYYAAVDIVVHPSIDEEAFGRIIIEAWASGRPIVASDIGASLELIRHEDTGLIVEQNNPSELAKALERLITAPDFAKKLAEAGSRQALNYGNGPLISAIEAIYDETIGRQN